MKKVPTCLIIDDPAPTISVFYEHAPSPNTDDGRPILPTYPNSFLFNFCDVVEKHGIKGKFSVVPMPGNKGDIINGIEGVSREDLDEWLDTVKTRLVPNFTIGPEMLTHNKAVNLADGSAYEMNEYEWSKTQDRTTLTPYIAKALQIVNDAGFEAIGATSPWYFGLEVEDEYYAAMSQAVYDVTGSKNAWVFLRPLRDVPNAKPWVELEEDGRTLVSIPPTTRDAMWQTIHCTETSDEYVSQVADAVITADGKSGEYVRVLETGGYPILITHWQSLFSNGLQTGIRVLDEIARRVNEHCSDKVEWMDFKQIMEMVVANKEAYPKPKFTPGKL